MNKLPDSLVVRTGVTVIRDFCPCDVRFEAFTGCDLDAEFDREATTGGPRWRATNPSVWNRPRLLRNWPL